MNPNYTFVAERASHRCEYCRAPESVFNSRFEVEHIWPQAHGGTDSYANLALACRACNGFKLAFTEGVDSETGERAPLFHPRQDRWEEHFAFDPATRRIRGRTPTGRVTVTRLHLNEDYQVEARARWATLDLFP